MTPRFACTIRVSCNEPAVRRRFDPLTGEWRPACAVHTKDATPLELLPLLEADAPPRPKHVIATAYHESRCIGVIIGTCGRCGAREVLASEECPA